jgi:hypothetical protein
VNELEELSERTLNDQVVLYSLGLNSSVIREAYIGIPDTIARLETQRLSAVNSNFHD